MLQSLTTPTNPQSELAYRPHIDGLRALAVLLVALYHFFPQAIPGGFIGVDVFYVISGYLISGILWHELKAGLFSYKGFITRRVRRLWPPFAIVLAAVLAAGWWLAMPQQFVELARTALAAIGLSANWYFAVTTDYFNTEAHGNALLHMWSLGVEEQFYLFFPFMLAALYRRWGIALAVLGVMTLLSLAASVLDGLYGSAADAFFFTHLRLWELLAGVLAMLMQQHPRWRAPTAGRFGDIIMCGSGVLMILVSAFAFSDETRFPGIDALLPVVGALLCLLSGDIFKSTPLTQKILCNSVAVYGGRISYSFYLWHWPMVVWYGTLFADAPVIYKVIALLLALALSALTYHMLEYPIRRRKLLASTRQLLLTMGLGTLLLAGAALAIINAKGYSERVPQAATDALEAGPDKRRSEQTCMDIAEINKRFGLTLQYNKQSAMRDLCLMGDVTRPQIDFVYWGDSHAESLEGAVHTAAKARNMLGLRATYSACPPVLNIGWKNLTAAEGAGCKAFNDNVLGIVQNLKPGFTLMVGHWDIYAPRVKGDTQKPGNMRWLGESADMPADKTQQFAYQLRLTLQQIKPYTSARLLLDVPTHDLDVPTAVAATHKWPWLPAPRWIARAEQEEHRASYAPLFTELQREGLATVYDPLKLFCPANACLGMVDGQPLFYDRNHMNARGGDYLLQNMPELLDRP